MQKWTSLLTVVSTVLLCLVLVAAVIHLASYIGHTLLLFALGALVAYALDPLVEFIRRTRISRSGIRHSREVAVISVFLGLFAVVLLAGWFLGGSLKNQVHALRSNYPFYSAKMAQLVINFDNRLEADGIHYHLRDLLAHPPADITSLSDEVEHAVLPVVGHFLTGLAESLIVLLISAYFLLSGSEMREKTNALFPADFRARAELWETDVNRILGGFVRGQITIALIIGLFAALGSLAIGIHIWLIIGLFAVMAALIPVFGPYIGAMPAILAALIGPTHLHSSVGAAVVTLIYFTIINEIGSKVLYPKLVGKALGLHAVLVLFVLFAGLEIGGVGGVLFAAPLTAVVIVTAVHLYRLWLDLPDDLISKNMLDRTTLRAKQHFSEEHPASGD